MKKLMVLAAMLAMMLAAASPAFAQDITITQGDEVQFNAGAQNLIGSVGDISQTQDATATAVAVDDSTATAEVSQTQDVSITQSNFAFNDFDGDGWWDWWWWDWWWWS